MLQQSDDITPADRQVLDNVAEATSRASNLTGQLLAFSRGRPRASRAVDVVARTRELRSLIASMLRENVTLHLELPDAPLAVMLEPAQWDQLVLNLVTNARDAMPRGGTLTVSLRGPEDSEDEPKRIRAEIHDTGQGMSRDVVDKVLEPFFTTKEAGKGTGLGLAIVHGIVTQLGGKLEIDSVPGSGTCVRMFFPASDAAELRSASDSRPSEGSGILLLVEDDELVRESTSVVLEGGGYEVVSVESGEKALHILAAHGRSFALVITDISMPGISGVDLAHRLEARAPKLPVLLTSGYPDQNPNGPGGDARREFLAKPYSNAELLTAVARLTAQADGPTTQPRK
jgi:CheY-like chemotaxis protein/anti-sigma regulatory factor (Ser/Thr protein kinase)